MLIQFKQSVAARLGIDQSAIFGNGLTLSEILSLSPCATNSIDLLEAFAGAIAENNLDDQLDIPAFTLDRGIDDVIDEIKRQLANVKEVPQ